METLDEVERLFTEGVRDAADRIDMDSEQRKNTRPDIDREDVVFADLGNGTAYSLAEGAKEEVKKSS